MSSIHLLQSSCSVVAAEFPCPNPSQPKSKRQIKSKEKYIQIKIKANKASPFHKLRANALLFKLQITPCSIQEVACECDGVHKPLNNSRYAVCSFAMYHVLSVRSESMPMEKNRHHYVCCIS